MKCRKEGGVGWEEVGRVRWEWKKWGGRRCMRWVTERCYFTPVTSNLGDSHTPSLNIEEMVGDGCDVAMHLEHVQCALPCV